VLNGKTQAIEDDINEASVQILNLVVANRQKVNLAAVVRPPRRREGGGLARLRTSPDPALPFSGNRGEIRLSKEAPPRRAEPNATTETPWAA